MANDTDGNGDELSITGFPLTSSEGGAIARDSKGLRYTPAEGFDTDTGDFNDDVLSVTGFSAISDQGHPITRDGNSLRYTPAIDFSGTDSFEYSISDGNGGIDSATVTITVPNAAPEAGDDEATVLLGTTGTIDVLANDTDGNGDELSITGFPLTSSEGGAIARDSKGLRYTPAEGFRGTDSFEYSISDGNGGTDSATVTITVPNAAPEAVNDDLLLPLTIDKAIFDVLANDVDLNGDDLYITDFPSTLPRGSMLLTKYFIQLNREVVIYIPISLDSTDPKAVNGTDPRAVNGTESFSYSISDGNGGTSSATATILIVNAAPEAVNDEVTVQVGTTSTIDVLANDTDTGDFNDDVLSVTGFSAISDQGHPITRDGNSLRYTPAIDFSGTDSFEYSISDGNGGIDSATVTITVEMMT